jgi:hypothetical protein
MTNNFPPKEFIRPLLITHRTTVHRSDFVFNENALGHADLVATSNTVTAG